MYAQPPAMYTGPSSDAQNAPLLGLNITAQSFLMAHRLNSSLGVSFKPERGTDMALEVRITISVDYEESGRRRRRAALKYGQTPTLGVQSMARMGVTDAPIVAAIAPESSISTSSSSTSIVPLVAGVAGGVVLLLVIALLAVYILRRRRQRKMMVSTIVDNDPSNHDGTTPLPKRRGSKTLAPPQASFVDSLRMCSYNAVITMWMIFFCIQTRELCIQFFGCSRFNTRER